MKFTSFFALAALTAVGAVAQTTTTPVSVAAAALVNDINAIGTGSDNIDSLVAAYPENGGTLAGALAIHNAAVALLSPINSAATDAANVPAPLSDSDAQVIINIIIIIRIPIIRHLLRLILIRPSFLALPVSGVSDVILGDLNNLSQATAQFQAALTTALPANALEQANGFFSDVNGAFASAISAYSQ